jgi:hypothetical protein
MQVRSNESLSTMLEAADMAERKLRGALSLLSMLYGPGRESFLALEDEYQDGYLDTLVDLAEDARRAIRQLSGSSR